MDYSTIITKFDKTSVYPHDLTEFNERPMTHVEIRSRMARVTEYIPINNDKELKKIVHTMPWSHEFAMQPSASHIALWLAKFYTGHGVVFAADQHEDQFLVDILMEVRKIKRSKDYWEEVAKNVLNARLAGKRFFRNVCAIYPDGGEFKVYASDTINVGDLWLQDDVVYYTPDGPMEKKDILKAIV